MAPPSHQRQRSPKLPGSSTADQAQARHSTLFPGAQPAFHGFPEFRSNVLYCPKQVFTVLHPHCSVKCILYPDGSNTPPQAHLKAGISLAKSIEALDRAGEASSAGKIVFMSVGMSNTTQEFQAFLELAEKDPEINPQLLLVDGAQGGQAAENTVSPSASYWKFVDQRLADAGATREQVQVVWIKQATREPRKPFPTEARNLQSHLTEILHVLNERFTNVRIAYVSSRIYAGYAVSPLSPEPHSYETAFAVKWLIEDQIAGKLELNHDAEKGTVRSPWLAWGPYLWADGLRPRSDGLTYRRDDLAKDGIHPATTGRRKVADLLLRFLKTDPTAKPWFFRPGSRTIRSGNRG